MVQSHKKVRETEMTDQEKMTAYLKTWSAEVRETQKQATAVLSAQSREEIDEERQDHVDTEPRNPA